MGRKDKKDVQAKSGVTEETSIKDVLLDAQKTDFDDETERNKFQEKHRVRLSKDPNSRKKLAFGLAEDEVLHAVARERGLGGYEAFTKWAVKTHRPLLEIKSQGGLTPLHVAIAKGNHEFVALVLEHAVDLRSLLTNSTDLRLTCLHLAINDRSPFTELIIAKAQETPGPGTTTAAPSVNDAGSAWRGDLHQDLGAAEVTDIFTVISKDDDKMTPLHLAVTSDQENPDGDGSYQYLSMGLGKSQQGLGIKVPGYLAQDYFTGGSHSPVRPSVPKLDHGGRSDGFVDMSEKNPANIKAIRRAMTVDMGKDPLQPKDGPASTRDPPAFNLLRIVQKLIEANPRVLVDYEDVDGDTPFQARLAYVLKSQEPDTRDVADPEAHRHETIENDPILRYMRAYIIDTFDRRDAMKALYKVGDERVLEFDLSGLPYSTINAEFLNGLRKVLRFEGLLKYVALPRLMVEDDEGLEIVDRPGGGAGGNAEKDQASKAKGKGLQHMCSIFRWLKKRHVKSVLKVTVIDDMEPSHSDEAIEACLEKLDVRVWNWYKVDLCCDVIANSAKRARDVTLYSSGNNAVLVGWSSSAGLAKLPELKSVYIYVQEGLEKPKRLEGYMDTFKTELKKHKPNVDFSWEFHKPDPNYNSVFEHGVEKATESRWIKSMKDFAEFLKAAKPDATVRPIKIAVIDDGISTALDIFTNRIQVGESFYRLGELSGRRGAYYVPSGPHGTLMAQLICEVCPVVKLYIAQLEVLPGQDGRRSFTAESATEAITWALNQGVDIISMSWSIKASSVLPGLENALQAAVNERIIMFCASIDEGATAVDRTYPGKEGNCIKIGASTGTGAKLSWVSESNSSFLVPGEATQQAAEPNMWRDPHLGSFGSSVATALAAGLAGMLLYCDRLIETPKTPIVPLGAGGLPMTPGRSHNVKEVDFLRSAGKMVQAFKNLSRGTELNKFPQVWDYLPQGSAAEPLVWNKKSYPDQTVKTKLKLEDFMKMAAAWETLNSMPWMPAEFVSTTKYLL